MPMLLVIFKISVKHLYTFGIYGNNGVKDLEILTDHFIKEVTVSPKIFRLKRIE